MTLQQLEYVVALADHGQFLKAAEACEVTQPTLSSMIQKLEEELGAKLFDRRSKPVVPTAVGRVVVEQARELLSGARRLRERVDEQQNAVSGEFRVAVLPTIAPYLLPRFLPEFSRKYAQVDLQIREMKTAAVKRALEKGDIDAAIVAQLADLEEFCAESLFYEQYFVYSSHNSDLHSRDSVRTADLREVPLWLLDEGHCFRDQLVSFCHLKSARRSQRSYHLGSIETFMRIVESGMGATFIPELCTLQLSDEQKKLVRPFALPVPTREIVLLTAKDFVRDSLKRLLVEEIRKAVPESMHRLSHAQKSI